MSSKSQLATRRAFLQGSAGAAGMMIMPVSMAGQIETDRVNSPSERAQRAFLEAVLHKHTGRSRKLRNEQVRLFSQRFTEEYGVVDYRRMYSGVAGEYELTRLFVRSVKLPASTKHVGGVA